MGIMPRLLVRHKKEPLMLYNTLGKSEQVFAMPPLGKTVRMYNCGPTVYDRQHIGNLSAAVFADVLRRVLEMNGYHVKQVINITDFGHLVSDADEGEDKMTKGLVRAGLALTMENMRDFATKYMELYLADIRALNVATDKIQFPRASDYVPAQIAMVQTLVEKGYAYETSDGVYFDTAHFPRYGELGGIDLDGLKEGARVAAHAEKHNPTDFALWKKSGSDMGWDSPWQKGYPGWHIECSAMIHSILGRQIDIHTGGIEHIAIHHNNEIAQSEAATGLHPFSRFWMHRAHIRMNDAKMAKSDGNVAYLSDVTERGISPAALRYWFLTSHYRTQSNFTWEAIEAAQAALTRLARLAQEAPAGGTPPAEYLRRLRVALNSDLDTPGALALVWEAMKDRQVTAADARALALEADTVFGLGLLSISVPKVITLSATAHMQADIQATFIPAEVMALFKERNDARVAKDWARADTLRDQITAAGYRIEDTAEGARLVQDTK